MKHALLATSAVLFFSSAATAEGLTYHGATFEGNLVGNFGSFGTNNRATKRSTVQADITGTDYFLQPEVSLNAYNFSAFSGTVGTHVGRNLDGDTAVGGFFMYNAWFPNIFRGGDIAFGAEARGVFGSYDYEAYGGLFANAGGIYGGVLRGEVWRPLGDRVDIGGGVGLLGAGGPLIGQGTLSATYRLTDNFKLKGAYTASATAGGLNHGVSIKLTYDRDGGTTFGDRSFLGLRHSF